MSQDNVAPPGAFPPGDALVEPHGGGSVTCLLVDDDPNDRFLVGRMLRKQGIEVVEAASGERAFDLLRHRGGIPLVISDMRMPGMSGLEFLERALREYPDTAVIMLTGLADTATAVRCLHAGAADYLLKPVMPDELRARVSRALEKRLLVLQNRFYQRHLERRVAEQARRIEELFLEAVQMLARALEAKDAYTRGHSVRVSRYAAEIATELGVRSNAVEEIRIGGELHDIGKIGVREAVLDKPGRLTLEEYHQITEHPMLGERMLMPLARRSPAVLRIVRSHHERMDGRGFPDGLVGARIPFEARIVAVADAFDAMTSRRPYRPARPAAEALEELRRGAGSQFDPDVVAAFIARFEDPPHLFPVAAGA
ncbi:MAG TPA: HD domain-containing phosphohydrolase [Gemmatimonadales bacterium]|nr:HD domain-containing phosphohydrolase [Gemmatimonadales bacterium]